MGGICSRRSTDEARLADAISHADGHINYARPKLVYQSNGLDIRDKNSPEDAEATDKQSKESFSFPGLSGHLSQGSNIDDIDDGIPRLPRSLSDKYRSSRPKQAAIAKVTEVSSLLGRAGTVGLGKAVDVLDTLGSSMTNLNLSSGFASGVTTKGIKVSILAFEVANTIVKGANLMSSLSEENVRYLKQVVLPSRSVQCLISRDIDELLRIAAYDKREELKIFSGEVIRFGNRCKDPQWHNLDRYFEKLELDLTPHKQLKEEAEAAMQQLMHLVQYTAELYHEMHTLDRFEQDCRRKAQEEDNSNTSQRGDSLSLLRADLKSQKKHVKNLKKKSLWSKILEAVMEKLVEIVHFLNLEIIATFGNTEDKNAPSRSQNQRLGSAGLALHYANIITQIDTILTRSSSVPPSTRDALYQGLPPSMKASLRAKLNSFHLEEELSVTQIKAEMEKTLQWLVPMATNTTKAHHGFGWVGEWANTGSEMNRRPTDQSDQLLRIETLYHADKEKTDAYILDMVIWLHHLITQSQAANLGRSPPVKSPIRSPNQNCPKLQLSKSNSPSPTHSTLTVEDEEMLRDVSKGKLTPGISKSQEFDTVRSCNDYYHRGGHKLSKSSSHSPTRVNKRDVPFPIRRPSSVPIVNFDADKVKALDVIDRVDSI